MFVIAINWGRGEGKKGEEMGEGEGGDGGKNGEEKPVGL